MEKQFTTWLTNLSEKLVKETYNDVKENNKLLFAKLCCINFCDSNGYFDDKAAKKVKNMSEKELIGFLDTYIYDTNINSIDDICNLFHDDMSELDNFFYTFCLYNGYYTIPAFRENVKNGNYDGVFEMIPMSDKVIALVYVTKEIKSELASIYTKEHLTKVWNALTDEEKLRALKAVY